MRLGKNRFLGRILAVLAVSGLTACGPDAEQTEPIAENGLAGFEPNAAPSLVYEEADAAQESADPPAAFAQAPVPDDSTATLSHDPENAGEDLYRRGFYEEALAQWEQDADAGDAYAAYRLGVEYFDAHHVERDIPLAARYQQLAAELGSAPAMFELGSFYEGGLGVAYDLELAGAWYFESARRGYPPAQHNVATMFEDGVGQPRDLVQAYLYYGLAVEQGFRVNFERIEPHEAAVFIDPRERLEQMMSVEELAQAQALFENFEPLE